MTIAHDAEIIVFFGLDQVGGDFFTIEHPTRGALDTGSGLAGDIGTNVTPHASEVLIRRGRQKELENFDAGTATIKLWNYDRRFDPSHASGPHFGELVPGKPVTVAINGSIVFSGYVADWDNEWAHGGIAEATLEAVDGLGDLARQEFATWTTTNGQLPGARITEILDRGEVNYGVNRDIDAGVSTLQWNEFEWLDNVLNGIQLIALSDYGRFFVSSNGTVVFMDRNAHRGATPQVTFSDNPATGILFTGVATECGSERLFNRVTVERKGGAPQSVWDTPSQDTYGVAAMSVAGLMVETDSHAYDMANYLLGLYKDPQVRVVSIVVNVTKLGAVQREAVTALDIGDVIRVMWTPRGVGSAVDQTLVIEGVEHSFAHGQAHHTRFHTSVLFDPDLFTIEDATLGALDTGGVLVF